MPFCLLSYFYSSIVFASFSRYHICLHHFVTKDREREERGMLHPAVIDCCEQRVVVKRLRCVRCSLTRFGHFNTKNQLERTRIYAWETS